MIRNDETVRRKIGLPGMRQKATRRNAKQKSNPMRGILTECNTALALTYLFASAFPRQTRCCRTRPNCNDSNTKGLLDLA